MSKTAIVYWSGTGNTESMANAVLDGAKEKGGEVTLFTASEFDVSLLPALDTVAFGCPAMGAEELEETEFAPMFESCLPFLDGKPIGLFGSYDWGDGEWMRIWEENCISAGAVLVSDPVICNNSPDEEGIQACIELGKTLV